MEKLTLNPQCTEITVNPDALDGAIDLFSYGPDSEASLHPLGSLYLIGRRDTDSGNMGYIVSLIAALAKREYYADADLSPRDAFAQMLKKVNEIVDDFFKSSSVDLSVGIFAVAGGSILVSKLDKFKILLARDGEVIDILTNVGLFNKEHVEKRRFSSIISGAVQSGDRILAYYPSKPVTTRERYLKSHLLKLSTPDFQTTLDTIARQHSSFATAMLCIDMVQSSDVIPEQPAVPELQPVPATYAWAPRQHASSTVAIDTEPEVPHIISTEFALGTRKTMLSHLIDRIRFVRLDTRGKAIFVGVAAVIVLSGVLVAKSLFFVDPEQQRVSQIVQTAKADYAAATKAGANPSEARSLLTRALSALAASDVKQDKSARTLSASLVQAMDTLDNAHAGTLTLTTQLDADTDTLVSAVYSPDTQAIWAVTHDSDNAYSAGRIGETGIATHIPLDATQPLTIVPLKSGILIVDAGARTVTRVMDGVAKSFPISTQDTILSAALYEGSLYVLTDHTILKVADLDTDKPATKQWLASTDELVANAAQIAVDGSVWVLGRDGMLTEYYKGKKKGSAQTPLAPSGTWRLLATGTDGQVAVANSDTKRIYLLTLADGSLARTLTIDTEQSIVTLFSGPDGLTYLVTKDNKIWSVK